MVKVGVSAPSSGKLIGIAGSSWVGACRIEASWAKTATVGQQGQFQDLSSALAYANLIGQGAGEPFDLMVLDQQNAPEAGWLVMRSLRIHGANPDIRLNHSGALLFQVNASVDFVLEDFLVDLSKGIAVAGPSVTPEFDFRNLRGISGGYRTIDSNTETDVGASSTKTWIGKAGNVSEVRGQLRVDEDASLPADKKVQVGAVGAAGSQLSTDGTQGQVVLSKPSEPDIALKKDHVDLLVGGVDATDIHHHDARYDARYDSDAAPSVTAGATLATSEAVAVRGVSTKFARQDHVHPHGSQTNPNLHQIVTTSAAGFMSGADKTKLNGIQDGATAYVHPANHPPGIISQDASNQFVTAVDKANWNGKQPSGSYITYTNLNDSRLYVVKTNVAGSGSPYVLVWTGNLTAFMSDQVFRFSVYAAANVGPSGQVSCKVEIDGSSPTGFNVSSIPAGVEGGMKSVNIDKTYAIPGAAAVHPIKVTVSGCSGGPYYSLEFTAL